MQAAVKLDPTPAPKIWLFIPRLAKQAKKEPAGAGFMDQHCGIVEGVWLVPPTWA